MLVTSKLALNSVVDLLKLKGGCKNLTEKKEARHENGPVITFISAWLQTAFQRFSVAFA